jgi:hypothetical protein
LPWQLLLTENRSWPILQVHITLSPLSSLGLNLAWHSMVSKALDFTQVIKTGLPFLGHDFSGPVLWGRWTSSKSVFLIKPA